MLPKSLCARFASAIIFASRKVEPDEPKAHRVPVNRKVRLPIIDRARPAVEPNRKVAYYKMVEAGLRIMPNNSRYEVEVWAHKTTNDFIRQGLIVIEDDLI